MVTENIPRLVIVLFSDEVERMKFLLDRYLFNVAIETYPKVVQKCTFYYYYWEHI